MKTSRVNKTGTDPRMYLVDTNVISEVRKGRTANPGVRSFFAQATQASSNMYLSVITIGELRRGVELIRHRGDLAQSDRLERWLVKLLSDYARNILPVDADVAQLWGRLRVPHHENAIDKQIAATAMIYKLAMVSRNTAHYKPTGVDLLNPFT